MKQFLLSCFLVLQMSERHVSTVWSGMEGIIWRDKSVEFVLPVSCFGFEKYQTGDDFLQSNWMREIVRGNPKNWEMKIVRKIVREDNQNEFSCF